MNYEDIITCYKNTKLTDEEVKSLETLNSQIPLWKKNKREVDEEQLNEFYKSKYYDYQDPIV